jgi:hypothetical protein
MFAPNVGSLFVHKGMPTSQGKYIFVVPTTYNSGDGNPVCYAIVQYPPIAFANSVLTHMESPQSISLININPCVVEDQIRFHFSYSLGDTLSQNL